MRRAHYPADRNRVPVHITLFRQLPPSAEGEIARRLAECARTRPPRAMLAGIIDLGGGTAFRVESEELVRLRGELADGLFGLLTPQDQGPWRPHVTIQNKVELREARKLQQQLAATFEPRPLRLRGLATWRYLGGPWEPIRTYGFRG